MINHVVLQGNAGNDPELKFSKDNLAIASFSIAHTPRSQKNGRWEDGETMWVKVVQFGEKAELACDTVKKGDSVIVTGPLKQVSYKGRDGVEKTGIEITATSISIAPRAKKKEQDLPSW